jgi:hypothetical protein
VVSRASIHVGPDTTVILDEAGMTDHKRLDALTELVEPTGTKLIAVGDGKQLPSIGPGGMFDRLTQHAPVVELETIHRTKDPNEQKAWQALRAGEPERAMAHYQARGRLHLADTPARSSRHAYAWSSRACSPTSSAKCAWKTTWPRHSPGSYSASHNAYSLSPSECTSTSSPAAHHEPSPPTTDDKPVSSL